MGRVLLVIFQVLALHGNPSSVTSSDLLLDAQCKSSQSNGPFKVFPIAGRMLAFREGVWTKE